MCGVTGFATLLQMKRHTGKTYEKSSFYAPRAKKLPQYLPKVALPARQISGICPQ
jgi:hypothetical protein